MRRISILAGACLVAACSSKPIPVAKAQTEARGRAPADPNMVVPGTNPERDLRELISEAFRPVYFPFDRTQLTDEAKAILERAGKLMKNERGITALIEGNTDERGSDAYNLALGERRAHAAKAYLVSYGIEASRLRVISFGEERPALGGHSETDWALNRRSDFKVDF